MILLLGSAISYLLPPGPASTSVGIGFSADEKQDNYNTILDRYFVHNIVIIIFIVSVVSS